MFTAFFLGFLLCILVAVLTVCMVMWFIRRSNNALLSKQLKIENDIKGYILKEILHSNYSFDDITFILNKNKLELGNPSYILAVFELADFEAESAAKDIKSQTIMESLRLYFTQNTNENFGFLLDINGSFAVLLTDVQAIDVTDVLLGAINILENDFSTTAVAGKSEVFDDISYIKFAYDEAFDSLAFRSFAYDSSVISNDEETVSALNYNSSDETKFINAIAANDKAASFELVNNFFKSNCGDDASIASLRILCFELISSIIRAKEKMNGELDYRYLYRMYHAVLICASPDLLKKLINELIASVTVDTGTKTTKRSAEKYQSIAKYIEDNFTNHMLNVNMISYAFGMNRTYLSDIFKKKTGIGIAEYIVKLRLEKAKSMLKSGAAVSEAAESSGFSSAVVFSRAFKKYEGTTPGKYKNMFNSGDNNPG